MLDLMSTAFDLGASNYWWYFTCLGLLGILLTTLLVIADEGNDGGLVVGGCGYLPDCCLR